MIELAIAVLLITALSLYVQEAARIPAPITLIGFVFIMKATDFELFHFDNATFDEVIILMLPILISVDAISLKISEIKAHGLSLLYLAVIAVLLSVFACVILNHHILPDYNLSTPLLMAMFCAVMATDPITVSAVFKNFDLPHDLKILAEGESLFNDATALIIFGIALAMLNPESVNTATEVASHSASVIVYAVVIGAITGLVGFLAMQLTRNSNTLTALMLAIGYIAYFAAEHVHASGILATIISMLIANHIISRRIDADEKIIGDSTDERSTLKKVMTLSNAVEDRAQHKAIIDKIAFISIFGSTILFVAMADIISLDMLVKYWKEIMAVFIATTIIRMIVLSTVRIFAGKVKFTKQVKPHWWAILSASGVKGGLSLLMLHMLPKDIDNLELIEAIITGVVLLSTFVYPLVLAIMIKSFNSRLKADAEMETHRMG